MSKRCATRDKTPKAFANWSPGKTPKAFANWSPGLERSDNPGLRHHTIVETLKGFRAWRTLSGLSLTL